MRGEPGNSGGQSYEGYTSLINRGFQFTRHRGHEDPRLGPYGVWDNGFFGEGGVGKDGL